MKTAQGLHEAWLAKQSQGDGGGARSAAGIDPLGDIGRQRFISAIAHAAHDLPIPIPLLGFMRKRGGFQINEVNVEALRKRGLFRG